MTGGNLLVVDDNPGDIRFIEEAFRTSQLAPTIHTVTTGGEALDFVHRRSEYEDAPELDVLLLDWNLSRTTGKEVLQAANSVDASIPVVVMTGSKSETSSVKSSLSQADQYIEKSTDPDRYVEVLRPYLVDD